MSLSESAFAAEANLCADASFAAGDAPAPTSVAVADDGRRRFKTVLTGERSALHLAPAATVNAYMSDIQQDDQTQSDLETLIGKTKNLTVRPLQMSALFGLLLKKESLWKAYAVSQRIGKEHPDFKAYFDASISSDYTARDAAKQAKWVEQKGKSPIFETEEDMRQFDPRAHRSLNADAVKALAERVAILDVSMLNPKEQLGRQFVLCQANGTAEDSRMMVKLAKQHPQEMRFALQQIEHLTVEKSVLLPFVISQIDPNFRAKQNMTADMEWKQNAAYSALRSFRTKRTAAQIIRFMNTTNDSLLIQGAVDALSETTLPELFDELAAVADRVFASSESAYMQYLDLLLRSDRDKAIPLMADLKARHPKMSHRILRALGRAGHHMALNEAVDLYHESSNIKGDVQSAISTLRDIAEPKDIAALNYRRGLEPWMNESLVTVIRMNGGDEAAFSFVEAFYKEFVAGKKKQHHLTCVAAFEQIGDPRAIPYLHDILKNTERKRDAATAIGNLMHDRRIKFTPHPLDEYIQTVQTATATSSATEDSVKLAWEVLLGDPHTSFRRMMERGSLRDAIENARSENLDVYVDRVPYVARFGTVAAEELLAASDGCSLEKRYTLAHLLQLVIADSRSYLQTEADGKTADSDRRLTARLALQLASE